MRARALLAVALLLACACKQQEPVRRHDDAVKQTLARIRGAIATFQREQGRYPRTLEELVPKYLPAVPVDPATGSAKSWRLVTEETVQPNADFTTATSSPTGAVIIDVRSGAPAPYSEY
ncbi:MAG TPA: hypothetical protein VGF28_12845 [Thermoanaerobaculia bacterium]